MIISKITCHMTEIKIGTEEHSSIYLTNYLLGAEHTVAQDNDNMMFVQYAYSYYRLSLRITR
jgi:hypothetical protein